MAQMHGFDLIREQYAPEINSTARMFRHARTGAELLSLENDDENKSFGITFRTPPPDSTGVAHILEHAVLCGSRKYPSKEPFVELLKSSVKTFLNALTFPDKTCYPVASQNLRDFYNLIDVYLDAVFYPRITPRILQQEGWHYELEHDGDPLKFKGVVFNEMKGVYSSPDSLIYRYSQQALFQDTVYGFDSGGDPKEIPNLTYEQFQRFHATHYHPSNALIFFSGDDDPTERLRIVNEYLKDFDLQTVDATISQQPRFAAPKQLTYTYASNGDHASQKSKLMVSWLLGETREPELRLSLSILSYALMGTPAAHLRKALIDSGLGEDVIGGGLSSNLRESAFSVGMKGVQSTDVEAVETLILATLERLSRDGIDPETIAAAINTIEFTLREDNTGSFPRGLSWMFRALSYWLHGEDPLNPLMFEAPLAAVKEHLRADERYVEQMIARFLLDNTHRVSVALHPDAEQLKREEAAEQARLEEARATMGLEDLQTLVEETRQLKLMQETPDPPEVLAQIPRLTLADLDRAIRTIPIDVTERNNVRVLHHDLFTSGIVYMHIGFDLSVIPQELLPYMALFGRVLMEMGTEKEDFVRLSQRIGRNTGGIAPSSLLAHSAETYERRAWFFLGGKATMEQADELLAILRDILLTVQLDNHERFRQIALRAKAGKESGLIPGGSSVVSSRLGARFNTVDWASEQISGVSNLFFLRRLVDEIDANWPLVYEKLEQIRRLLINRNAMICNVTLDNANWREFAPRLDELIAAMPEAETVPSTWTPAHPAAFEGLTVPTQVNYVGKAANLYDLGYAYHGSMLALTRLLRTGWLWDQIRVQGGAYGSFCNFGRDSGLLTFVSYRDPNLLNTLDVYDRAGSFLRKANLSQTELERVIIGAVGDMDAYRLPDAKGYTSMVRYLLDITDESRQQIRDELFATGDAEVRALADVLEQFGEHGHIVVLGSQTDIEAANAQHPGMLEITRVL